MAAFGSHGLDIPDGTERASAVVAFSEYTNSLDLVLDQISTQADGAASSVGEVSEQYGSLSAVVAGHTTSIDALTAKTAALSAAGTVLVVRQTIDFSVSTDAAYTPIPFNTVEYKHPSSTFTAGVWTAPVSGRVRVTGAALPVYGSAIGTNDRTGFPTILTAVRSGTRFRMGHWGSATNGGIISGTATFTVTAGQTITLSIYMNSTGNYKTLKATANEDSASYMMIEYLRDAEIS